MVILIVLAVSSIGADSYFSPARSPQIPKYQEPVGKCGDGMCDAFEKKNPDVCLRDCVNEHPSLPALVGKCGDKICDAFEKAHPNACPEDCADAIIKDKEVYPCPSFMPSAPSFYENCLQKGGSVTPGGKNDKGCLMPPQCVLPMESSEEIKTSKTVNEDSPFGFHENLFEEKYFADVGAKWIRLSGPVGLVWDADEPEPGRFDWSRLDKAVNYYSKIADNILLTLNSFNRLDQEASHLPKHKIPNNPAMYGKYLKTAAARYPQVNYFQIENEPANEWADTPENFAELVKVSADAIKEVNSRAKIVLAGAAVPGEFEYFYRPLLKELKRLERQDGVKYLNAVDIHWSGQFENKDKSQATYRNATISKRNYNYKAEIEVIRKILDDSGYKDAEIWVTEMSDYSGNPSDPVYLDQSEREQAGELFKRYVYSLAIGVKKIFWVALMEFHNFGGVGVNNYWDNVGLVNNPLNDGESHKKLSYYAYKKMVDVLEGCDWNHIQTIREKDGVYVYKFIKSGKPIWVAWNDGDSEKDVVIEGIRSEEVKITESVPDYSSGKDIHDDFGAFSVKIERVGNGKARIKIKDIPVFVEESRSVPSP